MEINKKLILIKLHYFLFFGALGPILPFINVIGKQLQISELVMGTINALLPLAVLVAKPGFGYALDLFHRQRKLLFMILIGVMGVAFCLLAVVPPRCRTLCVASLPEASLNGSPNNSSLRLNSPTSAINTSLSPVLSIVTNNTSLSPTSNLSSSSSKERLHPQLTGLLSPGQCRLECDPDDLYRSWNFWAFALFTSLGILGFNIVSSTSDAVCFDMLGAGNEAQYGTQRMFGTVGYALSALGAGWAIDHYSAGGELQSYAPAYWLVLLFGGADLVCCALMRLPRLAHSKSILKDVSKVMRRPYVKSFLVFAAMAGFCEGFVIYNLFWYMEDLAKATGSLHSIKLLQGLTVAAETIFGELLVFYFSERIIGRLGYGHCLTFCFSVYFLRLGLIALAPSAWCLLPIELLTQGPSYALTYTCVVVYASAIAPVGASATMQGVMAGANDGFGFSIASFVGGALYTQIGGQLTFAFFSLSALTCAIAHAIVYHRAEKKMAVSKAQEHQLAANTNHDKTTTLPVGQTKLRPEENEDDPDDNAMNELLKIT